MRINSKILKIIIILLILSIYGLTLTHPINLTTDDLGRHLTNGQIIWQTKTIPQTNFYSYTEPDYAFINHHWLSGLIFYGIFNLFGFNGLIIFKIIILLIAFYIIFYISSKKGNFWLAALFSIPTIILLNQRTDVRPEIISFLFIALFLYLLIFHADKSNKKIFLLIPFQLIWVNCHIYFLIGILMTGAYVANLIFRVILRERSDRRISREERSDDPCALYKIRIPSCAGRFAPARFFASLRMTKTKYIIRLFIILIILILISLINPAGIKGLTYPLNIFKNYGYQIVENKSPFFLENMMHNPIIPVFKIVLVVLLTSFLFNLKKFSVFLFVASAAVVIAAGKMLRNIPMVGLIGLPVLSINFSRFIKIKKIKFKKILILLFIIILIIINIYLTKDAKINLAFQTNNSAEFFKNNNLSGPIFNNYDIGSYLIFHLYPEEKVFVDNRPEAYSKDFFEQIYKPMQLDETEWQKNLEKYNFNIIFFTQQEATPWGRTFVNNRFQDDNWTLIHADSKAIIFLKNNNKNKNIINKFKITANNIENKISDSITSENIKIKLSAINLLKLINNNDLALEICQEIIAKNPKQGKAYLEIASIESSLGTQIGLLNAKRYIEKAIELGENLPFVYNSLGLINFQLNNFQEAKNAWQKALKINKNDDSAKEYLRQYQALNLP